MRDENLELFRLVIGGYGNFGLITSATLRLTKKLKYKRLALPVTVSSIPAGYEDAVRQGAVYGDFQCNINEKAPGFLSDGIFSAYFPTADDVPLSGLVPMLDDEWVSLVQLAHKDKASAFKIFQARILATSGAVSSAEYWQSSRYVDGYHGLVDRRLEHAPGSEVLTEFYVPLKDIGAFMEDIRKDALANGVNIVYSTVRFIERDDQSFLPWARALSACVIFNIHTELDEQSRGKTADTCRRFIDHAIKYGGRYYLTYHRFATKEQVLACYPEFPEFLRLKKKYDPNRVFRSDWYVHYEKMFGE